MEPVTNPNQALAEYQARENAIHTQPVAQQVQPGQNLNTPALWVNNQAGYQQYLAGSNQAAQLRAQSQIDVNRVNKIATSTGGHGLTPQQTQAAYQARYPGNVSRPNQTSQGYYQQGDQFFDQHGQAFTPTVRATPQVQKFNGGAAVVQNKTQSPNILGFDIPYLKVPVLSGGMWAPQTIKPNVANQIATMYGGNKTAPAIVSVPSVNTSPVNRYVGTSFEGIANNPVGGLVLEGFYQFGEINNRGINNIKTLTQKIPTLGGVGLLDVGAQITNQGAYTGNMERQLSLGADLNTQFDTATQSGFLKDNTWQPGTPDTFISGYNSKLQTLEQLQKQGKSIDVIQNFNAQKAENILPGGVFGIPIPTGVKFTPTKTTGPIYSPKNVIGFINNGLGGASDAFGRGGIEGLDQWGSNNIIGGVAAISQKSPAQIKAVLPVAEAVFGKIAANFILPSTPKSSIKSQVGEGIGWFATSPINRPVSGAITLGAGVLTAGALDLPIVAGFAGATLIPSSVPVVGGTTIMGGIGAAMFAGGIGEVIRSPTPGKTAAEQLYYGSLFGIGTEGYGAIGGAKGIKTIPKRLNDWLPSISQRPVKGIPLVRAGPHLIAFEEGGVARLNPEELKLWNEAQTSNVEIAENINTKTGALIGREIGTTTSVKTPNMKGIVDKLVLEENAFTDINKIHTHPSEPPHFSPGDFNSFAVVSPKQNSVFVKGGVGLTIESPEGFKQTGSGLEGIYKRQILVKEAELGLLESGIKSRMGITTGIAKKINANLYQVTDVDPITGIGKYEILNKANTPYSEFGSTLPPMEFNTGSVKFNPTPTEYKPISLVVKTQPKIKNNYGSFLTPGAGLVGSNAFKNTGLNIPIKSPVIKQQNNSTPAGQITEFTIPIGSGPQLKGLGDAGTGVNDFWIKNVGTPFSNFVSSPEMNRPLIPLSQNNKESLGKLSTAFSPGGIDPKVSSAFVVGLPGATVAFASQLPGGLAVMATRPEIIPKALAYGVTSQGEALAKDPGEYVFEFAASMYLGEKGMRGIKRGAGAFGGAELYRPAGTDITGVTLYAKNPVRGMIDAINPPKIMSDRGVIARTTFTFESKPVTAGRGLPYFGTMEVPVDVTFKSKIQPSSSGDIMTAVGTKGKFLHATELPFANEILKTGSVTVKSSPADPFGLGIYTAKEPGVLYPRFLGKEPAILSIKGEVVAPEAFVTRAREVAGKPLSERTNALKESTDLMQQQALNIGGKPAFGVPYKATIQAELNIPEGSVLYSNPTLKQRVGGLFGYDIGGRYALGPSGRKIPVIETSLVESGGPVRQVFGWDMINRISWGDTAFNKLKTTVGKPAWKGEPGWIPDEAPVTTLPIMRSLLREKAVSEKASVGLQVRGRDISIPVDVPLINAIDKGTWQANIVIPSLNPAFYVAGGVGTARSTWERAREFKGLGITNEYVFPQREMPAGWLNKSGEPYERIRYRGINMKVGEDTIHLAGIGVKESDIGFASKLFPKDKGIFTSVRYVDESGAVPVYKYQHGFAAQNIRGEGVPLKTGAGRGTFFTSEELAGMTTRMSKVKLSLGAPTYLVRESFVEGRDWGTIASNFGQGRAPSLFVPTYQKFLAKESSQHEADFFGLKVKAADIIYNLKTTPTPMNPYVEINKLPWASGIGDEVLNTIGKQDHVIYGTFADLVYGGKKIPFDIDFETSNPKLAQEAQLPIFERKFGVGNVELGNPTIGGGIKLKGLNPADRAVGVAGIDTSFALDMHQLKANRQIELDYNPRPPIEVNGLKFMDYREQSLNKVLATTKMYPDKGMWESNPEPWKYKNYVDAFMKSREIRATFAEGSPEYKTLYAFEAGIADRAIGDLSPDRLAQVSSRLTGYGETANVFYEYPSMESVLRPESRTATQKTAVQISISLNKPYIQWGTKGFTPRVTTPGFGIPLFERSGITTTGTGAPNALKVFNAEYDLALLVGNMKPTTIRNPYQYVNENELLGRPMKGATGRTVGQGLLDIISTKFTNHRIGGSFGQGIQTSYTRPFGDLDFYVPKSELAYAKRIIPEYLKQQLGKEAPKMDIHELAPVGSGIGRYGVKVQKDITVEGLHFMPIGEQALRKITQSMTLMKTDNGLAVGPGMQRGKDVADVIGIGKNAVINAEGSFWTPRYKEMGIKESNQIVENYLLSQKYLPKQPYERALLAMGEYKQTGGKTTYWKKPFSNTYTDFSFHDYIEGKAGMFNDVLTQRPVNGAVLIRAGPQLITFKEGGKAQLTPNELTMARKSINAKIEWRMITEAKTGEMLHPKMQRGGKHSVEFPEGATRFAGKKNIDSHIHPPDVSSSGRIVPDLVMSPQDLFGGVRGRERQSVIYSGGEAIVVENSPQIRAMSRRQVPSFAGRAADALEKRYYETMDMNMPFLKERVELEKIGAVTAMQTGAKVRKVTSINFLTGEADWNPIKFKGTQETGTKYAQDMFGDYLFKGMKELSDERRSMTTREPTVDNYSAPKIKTSKKSVIEAYPISTKSDYTKWEKKGDIRTSYPTAVSSKSDYTLTGYPKSKYPISSASSIVGYTPTMATGYTSPSVYIPDKYIGTKYTTPYNPVGYTTGYKPTGYTTPIDYIPTKYTSGKYTTPYKGTPTLYTPTDYIPTKYVTPYTPTGYKPGGYIPTTYIPENYIPTKTPYTTPKIPVPTTVKIVKPYPVPIIPKTAVWSGIGFEVKRGQKRRKRRGVLVSQFNVKVPVPRLSQLLTPMKFKYNKDPVPFNLKRSGSKVIVETFPGGTEWLRKGGKKL
jgi:hypothetical protein